MSEPDDRSPHPWRTPDMVVPFVLYVVVIVAGLAFFIVVGLTHH